MKRLLTILLLVLIPLQVTWAAVGVYCQHESDMVTQHIGHHTHEHKSDSSSTDKSDSTSKSVFDNDCGTCHAGCFAVLVSDQTNCFLTAKSSYSEHIKPNYSLHGDRPDRPQWHHFA